MQTASIREFGPPSVLGTEELEVPALGPTDIKIEVSAAAVNPVDVKTRSGFLGLDLAMPSILGWDVSGTVVDTGEEASQFVLGDTVVGMIAQPVRGRGTYAEYVVADQSLFASAPRTLPLSEAAALPLAGLTATQLLEKVDLSSPSRVLVTGAGGSVAQIAIQLLLEMGHRVAGLGRAFDTSSLEQQGLAEVYSSTDDLPQGVFDSVLDTAGLAETISAVRDGGEFIGIDDNEQPRAERGITPRKSYVQENGQMLTDIVNMVDDGKLSIRIHGSFSLTEAAAAHTAFEAGGIRGKVLVQP